MKLARSTGRSALVAFTVGVLVLGSERLETLLAIDAAHHTLAVQLPAGIALGATVLFGPIAALGMFFGSVASEMLHGTSHLPAVIMGLGAAGSTLSAYWILLRGGRPFSVDRPGDVLRIFVAATTAAVVATTFGIGTHVLFEEQTAAEASTMWLPWFGSEVLGIMLVAPVIVFTARSKEPASGTPEPRPMFFAILVGFPIAAILWQSTLLPPQARPIALTLMGFLMALTAFRFRPLKTSLLYASFISTAVFVGTRHGEMAHDIDGMSNLQFLSNSMAVVGYFIVATVATQNRASERLRLAGTVFENTNDGIVITKPDSTIVDVNDAYMQIHGCRREAVIGKDFSVFKSDRHPPDFYQSILKRLDESGEWHGEVWEQRADGRVFPKLLSISRVNDPSGHPSHYVGVFSDITHIKEAEEELRRMSTHDVLTSLPNRALIDDMLTGAIARGRRTGTQVGVMFFDLDDFKMVNDTLGHSQGDKLLVQVGERVKAAVREADTVGRLGGDEFIVLAPDIEKMQDLDALAARVLESLARTYMLSGREAHASASLGIAVYPEDGMDAATLIQHADVAMYKSKELGRNRSQFFSSQMQDDFDRRVRIENGLRNAMRQRDLFLLYQPQVRLTDGTVEAVEALVRWRAKDAIVMMPDDFIPVAEDTGLIIPLGEWVLRTACREIAALRERESRNLRVAVNFSARQFRELDVADLVQRALEESGLPPEALEVEVTESSLMYDPDDAAEKVACVKRLGASVALDDFGTGFSSLKYVRLFDPDVIKIDQYFVQGLPYNSDSRAIVLAVVALAESLGIKAAAEGPETQQQIDFLRHNACGYAQGFYFSRPQTVDDLARWLKETPVEMTADASSPTPSPLPKEPVRP